MAITGQAEFEAFLTAIEGAGFLKARQQALATELCAVINSAGYLSKVEALKLREVLEAYTMQLRDQASAAKAV